MPRNQAWILTLLLAVISADVGNAAESSNKDDPIFLRLPESVRAERVLSRRPNDKNARLRVARAHLLENPESGEHLQIAEDHAVAVLAEQPNHLEALLIAARTNLLQGDVASAARYYKAATVADATNATAFLGLGDALSRLGDEAGSAQAFARYRGLKGMPPLKAAASSSQPQR